MDIRLGEQVFQDVQIPLMWGSRAVSQDREGGGFLVLTARQRMSAGPRRRNKIPAPEGISGFDTGLQGRTHEHPGIFEMG